MNKLRFWALLLAPMMLFGCTKKSSPPLLGKFYEVTPLNGGSSITFHDDYSFTIQDLRVSSQSFVEYKYRVDFDSRLIMTPPTHESYASPGPVGFRFTAPDTLVFDNFRPHLWGQVSTITFKRQ
ncbi:MAG: hypothetical protein J7578_08010 [Chitinophagaceae bacterium]|nr:hypothetical protein [Chitinophagaceae bacterium]